MFLTNITSGPLANPAKIDSSSADFFNQQAFVANFSKGLHLEINADERLKTVASEYFANMHDFIDAMEKKGLAEMEGTDTNCRAVCVSVQGAIEEVIAKQLQSGELKAAKAVFLTPLPCTPLRKSGETKGLSSEAFEPARQYTLDKREETVRVMMKHGCLVVPAYSKEEFEKFVSGAESSSDKANQVGIYKTAQAEFGQSLQDVQLQGKVPEELVGALYLLTDKEGNHYYLATQGVQALHAKPALWKKWLGYEGQSSAAEERAKKMLEWIESTGGPAIGF